MIKSLHFTEDFVTIEYDNGQKLIEPLATFIATLYAVAISSAIITESNLDDCDITGTELDDCTITDTGLDDCTITDTELNDCEITESSIYDSEIAIKEGTPVNATKATVTTDIQETNAELVFTARTAGTAGNNIKVEYINTWAEDGEGKGEEGINIPVELSVSVADNTVTVKLGTDDAGVITSKANDIKGLINGTDGLPITADNKQGDSGEGLVTVMSPISLATGVDGTVAVKRQVCADDTYLYVAKDNNDITSNNWRRIALGSVY